MKILLTLLALTLNSFAGTPVLARITPEALAKLQNNSPMTRLEVPTEVKARGTDAERPSIIKDSLILHDGKNWTLIPKGSVIFLPEILKSRVDAKPCGNLLTFAEFIVQNRNWITTNEVSFDQAAGNKALPAERLDFWSKQDKIVVAVHQSGPISVVLESSKQLTKR